MKGMKLENATEFFGSSKLRYNAIDPVLSKDVTPGSIVELALGVGSKAKGGRVVFVTINVLTSQTVMISEAEDSFFH